MPRPAPIKKIATCCYCGTRAALVLAGESQHELACSSCGAPLHNLKQLPLGRVREAREAAGPTHVRHTPPKAERPKPRKSDNRPKKRKKKRIGRKIFEEIWDVVEDIFD